MGKVYLVGAGPGAAKFITLAGLDKLKQCDAVIYDRLVDEALLDYVKSDCEKVYVGKEAGKHYKKQEEINKILTVYAKTYNTVVRLKGGDPFVFGRGGEEIEALSRQGISCEVIPGVTSAVAVPECAGIPVTHRDVSRSFHVITGHTKDSAGSPDYDYETLAKAEGTLVFLMGLSNLGEIAERLIYAGKPEDTPAAVICDGATAYQKVVRGTLKDIRIRAEAENLSAPAVIVIGKTADYRYCSSDAGCKRVGITATGPVRKKLEKGLKEIGMIPVSVCNMKVVLTEQIQELEREMHHLKRYHWILFTSQNGVQIFFEQMKQQGIDIRTLCMSKFAVIGSGTAAKLAEYGIQADFIPSQYTTAVFAREFTQIAESGMEVLIPRAVQGSKELPNVLKEHKISCHDIPIYDVTGSMTKNIKYLDYLDYLVFVSASGVTAFFRELRREHCFLPEHVKLACIGSVTQKRLLEECGRVDVTTFVNDIPGLLEMMKDMV